MTKAALLPHPADPFLFHYWLKFFNTVWGHEVDHLYIHINSPMEKPVIDWMMGLVSDNPKITLQYLGYQIEHGQAIDEMLSRCTEDLVMLIEDDGFIFKSGVVSKYFGFIENNIADLVGSPRGSCSQEIWDAAARRWGLDYSGYGDVGPNFWPNFFFIRSGHLKMTDRRFGARSWKQGDTIEALDYVVQDEVCPSDTFVNTSLQLRNMDLKIMTIPQYHASPDDLEHHQRAYNLFDGQAPWVHIGSLSSGVHGVLIDDKGRKLARRSVDPEGPAVIPGVCTTDAEKREWTRRVVMWTMFVNFYTESFPDNPLGEFAAEYINAIDRIITQFELPISHVQQWIKVYKELGL
jgi:hypothetical protein